MNRIKVPGLIAAIIVVVAFYLAPVPEGLSDAGMNVLGLLLAGLILWVTEAVPLAITAFALIILQPVLGIGDSAGAFKSFIIPVIFFVIASYGISIAVMKTPLAARMARWLLQRAGDHSERVILAFMIGTAVLSAIISNVPVTALFMGLSIGIIEASGGKAGAERLAKCLMIAIPFAAMIGGIATPAGSSINILALYLLDTYTQVTVSFVEWMVFGVPLCIVLIPISWFILIKVFKPEPIAAGVTDSLGKDLEDGLTVIEKKLLLVTGVMVGLWIISSWVPAIDITVVAVAGLIAYFIPGIDVLDWDEFVQGVGWEAVIMIGGVTSLGAAVVQTGLGSWFVTQSLQGLASFGVIPLTIAVGALVNILHLVLPIAPALVAVTVPPLSDLALLGNINPAIFAIATSFLAGCSTIDYFFEEILYYVGHV